MSLYPSTAKLQQIFLIVDYLTDCEVPGVGRKARRIVVYIDDVNPHHRCVVEITIRHKDLAQDRPLFLDKLFLHRYEANHIHRLQFPKRTVTLSCVNYN